MNKHRRLGEDALWLLVARFGTQGLMVLFTILIARRLGEVGMGEYAFVAAVIVLSNVLTTFGTDMLLIREVAAGEGLTQLPTALVIQLILSLAFVVLAIFGAPLLPGQSRAAVLALQIYSLALIPLAFYSVFTAALRGKRRMDLYMLLNVTVSLLQVATVWLFLRPDGSVVIVAILLLVVQLIAALIAGAICAICIPDFRRIWRWDAASVPAVLRASAPIALLGLLGMLYQKLSVYMLATFAGAATTGWFSAALRVVEASKTGHLALFGALYPAMSQAYNASVGDAHREEVFSFSWKVLLPLAGAVAIALFFLGEPLIAILYGPAFVPSASALKVLAWMMIPYTVNTYLSLAFVASGREQAVSRALLAGLITLAALNAWMIPRAGLAGACWAALAAELIQSVFLLFSYQRYQIKSSLVRRSERTP